MDERTEQENIKGPVLPEQDTGLATVEPREVTVASSRSVFECGDGNSPAVDSSDGSPDEYRHATHIHIGADVDYDAPMGGGYASVKGKTVSSNRAVWIVLIVMTVMCVVVGICSSVLTGYFMRRGVTPPKIDSDGKYEQIAAVVAARKPCIVEVTSGPAGSFRGSGVIMKLKNDKIYILTNNHVLNNSSVVSVKFEGDDDYWHAETVGYDPYYDIAVISVPSTVAPYTVYELDGSEYFTRGVKYREGDIVVAIGNAMGYGIASYDGIISRAAELIDYTDDYTKTVPVLRTTAAINAGMSGGALFDSDGNFIGLNTYRLANTSSNPNADYTTDVEDTSFVTPVSIVYPVYKQIMEYGDGGNINVSGMMQTYKDKQNSEIGAITFLFNGSGGFTATYKKGKLTVTSLDGGTPASGIQIGDVITSVGAGSNAVAIDNNICNTVGEFLRYRYNGASGTELTINVTRDGDAVSVGVPGYYRVA